MATQIRLFGAIVGLASMLGCTLPVRREVEPVRVSVPVIVRCQTAVDVPDYPAIPDPDKDLYQATIALLIDREMRVEENRKLRAALVGCAGKAVK